MIRILCVSSKGGVGKSSIAQQVAATYLLRREGAARLVELDDQNLDSQWLKKSKIETKQIVVDGDSSMAVLDVFEAMAGKSFVLDLGNQTAADAIAAMGMSKTLSRFDLILVPVRDVGQDLINCRRTIEEIRSHEPNANIAIVINGIAVSHPSRLKMLYGRIFDCAADANLPVLTFPFVVGYGQSREFEATLLEIVDESEKLIDFFHAKAVELDKAGKARDSRDCMCMVEIINIAIKTAPTIESLHSQIDELLAKREEVVNG